MYGELARFPLVVSRKIRIDKFWFKIKLSEDTLLHKAYTSQLDNNGNVRNKSLWAFKVKQLLSDLGFSYLWNAENITRLQIEKVIERIRDQFLQQWYSALRNSTKLNTYTSFKMHFCSEKYLDVVNNDNHRKALSRLRCSAHRLEIEEGRYRNIDRHLRLCKYCTLNQVESEYHFVLICPRYTLLRQQILPRYYYTWPSLNKLISLLQCEQTGVLRKLAKFVYLANEVRASLEF